MPSRLPPVRYVDQVYEDACAVAAVAMVCGVTLHEAIYAAHGNRNRGRELNQDGIMRCIRKLGFECRRGADFRSKKQRAIMMFEWTWCRGIYHCVVWNPRDRMVLDPSKDYPYDAETYFDLWRKWGKHAVIVTGRA